MKKNILISMLGNNDCNLHKKRSGSIISIIKQKKINFTKVIILVDENGKVMNYKSEIIKKYSDSIPEIKKYFEDNFPNIELVFENIKLNNPIDYGEVYPKMYDFVKKINKKDAEEKYYISITSGTSTMSASWIFLVKGSHIDAEIIQTSPQKGLNIVNLEIKNFPEIKTLDDAKIEISQLKNENDYLKKMKLVIEIPEIIGNSPQMIEIKKQIQHLAKYDIPVMILGETGTGKELVAKALHEYSSRKDNRFLTVNCGAISENLVESEFFGYVKGAFSGAMKDTAGVFEKVGDGTLFLDEIGDLPLFMQVKLLRVLNEKKYSKVGAIGVELQSKARIVAATNKNLWQLMKEGKFREDLFFRLTDDIIELPTLKERVEDLEDIANFILTNLKKQYGKKLTFSKDAIKKLKNYDWNGNIRELGQVVRRSFIFSEKIIKEENIRFLSSKLNDDKNEIKIPKDGLNFEKDIEIGYYKKALEITNGNINKASELLGIKYHTFNKRVKKYDIK